MLSLTSALKSPKQATNPQPLNCKRLFPKPGGPKSLNPEPEAQTRREIVPLWCARSFSPVRGARSRMVQFLLFPRGPSARIAYTLALYGNLGPKYILVGYMDALGFVVEHLGSV